MALEKSASVLVKRVRCVSGLAMICATGAPAAVRAIGPAQLAPAARRARTRRPHRRNRRSSRRGAIRRRTGCRCRLPFACECRVDLAIFERAQIGVGDLAFVMRLMRRDELGRAFHAADMVGAIRRRHPTHSLLGLFAAEIPPSPGKERRCGALPPALSWHRRLARAEHCHRSGSADAQRAMAKRYQVIIVGGGPVGVRARGRSGPARHLLRLVERRTDMHRIPKGQNLHPRTLEHFYRWGIADALRAERIMPPGYPISGITAYGNLMSEYWFAPPQREIVRPYYFQTPSACRNISPKKCCAPRWRPCPASRRGSAGRRNASRRTTEACSVDDRRAGRRARDAGRRLCRRLRRRALHRARADRHRARRRRFRPAHGAGGVPLARTARGAEALSRPRDLSGAAARS